jgi:hypothetical protein
VHVEVAAAPALYVEVVQLRPGEEKPYPLHWAIYVETGLGIYHITGNSDNYAIDIRIDQPLENRKGWRGIFTVGTATSAEPAK